MKKIFTVLAVAAFALLALSCAKKATLEPETETVINYHPDTWTYLPMEPTLVPTPGHHTLSADYGQGAKSQLSMNGEQTHADVVWTANDCFTMVGYNDEMTGFGYVDYVTADGGALASFEADGTLSSSNFHSIYPASAFYYAGVEDNEPVFGLTVPREQAATAGSVAEEANLSYAHSTSQDEDLHFKNFVSLLKFRLSGDLVPQIKSVRFIGTTNYMSGTFVVQPNGDGTLNILANAFFTSSPQYKDVFLNGDFETDTDYYIAMAPGMHNGFSMVFYNADGTKSVKKFSGKTLTLNRSRITDFGTINVGSAFDAADAYAQLYITHKTEKYATIAVLPDGYTAEQLADYELDARSAIDALFNTEPYKSYRDYFNVWIMKVASHESGARIYDGTAEEQNRDCFFQSTWEKSKYDHMSANADIVFGFVEENCPDVADGSHSIENVPVLLIINDSRYGGIAINYGSGRTYCMAPRAYSYTTMGWNYPSTEASSVTAAPGDTRQVTSEEKAAMGTPNSGDWRNVVVHEFGGHSIGKLGDEYWYNSYSDAVEAINTHTWPVPMSLNVSAKSDPSLTPWAELFDAAIQDKMATISPLYAERISVFQGAAVSMFNRWRSERISCMIDNRFYFSTWQRYILVNRFMTLAGLPGLTVSEFLDHDVPTDPNRDVVSSPVMLPDGVTYLPPRMMPMLPPPVLHDDL